MPRKTSFMAVRADSIVSGFNEAAARCRGKPAELAADAAPSIQLQ